LLGILVGVGLTFTGLARAGRLAPSRPEAIVSLAQLLEVEHRRVDLLLDRGDTQRALALLDALRREPWPEGDLGTQLRHDVYGRLLRLRIDEYPQDPSHWTGLLELTEEGLGLRSDANAEVTSPNPFTARLWALHGEVLEGLGRDDDALLAYEKALAMNRVLLDRELQADP